MCRVLQDVENCHPARTETQTAEHSTALDRNMSKGKLQAAWLSTPKFDESTNFKELFLKDDALCNVESELAFSIFHRYTCKADCKMCYVQDEWVDDELFANKFVPAAIPPEVEARIIETFSFFDVVVTVDDLFYIKKTYPHLYEFYVRNSHLMSSSSMTDMAFIQQWNLILDEMNFQMIYEISFSDRFLKQNDGKMSDKVLERLKIVHEKSPIQKMKFIFCDPHEYGVFEPPIQQIMTWAEENNIYVDSHDDIMQGQNKRYDDVHQETNHLQAADNSAIYQILCEVTYMQYTSMFLTISQTIGANSIPFFDVMAGDKFDASTFLVKMVRAKLNTYVYYLKKIKTSCERITGNRNKYFDYFTYVSENVVVNNNFNFIPRFMLKPFAKFYEMLAESEYIDTAAGLLRHGTTEPVPIITLSGKPQLKIEHIPIVNK
jgi:hypothetical protein